MPLTIPRRSRRRTTGAPEQRAKSCTAEECCFEQRPAGPACFSPGACGCKAGEHPEDMAVGCSG